MCQMGAHMSRGPRQRHEMSKAVFRGQTRDMTCTASCQLPTRSRLSMKMEKSHMRSNDSVRYPAKGRLAVTARQREGALAGCSASQSSYGATSSSALAKETVPKAAPWDQRFKIAFRTAAPHTVRREIHPCHRLCCHFCLGAPSCSVLCSSLQSPTFYRSSPKEMTARTLQRSPCRQLGFLLLALLAAACLRLPLVDAVTRLKHAQSLVSRLSSTHWTDKTESLELCPTSPGGNTWTSLDPAALPGSVAVAGKTFFLLSGGGGAAKACQRDSATRQLNAASVLTAFKIKPLHRHSQILVLCVLPRRAAALLTRSSSLSSADAVGLELGRGQAGRTDTAGGDAAPRGKRLDGHEAQAPAAPTANGRGGLARGAPRRALRHAAATTTHCGKKTF